LTAIQAPFRDRHFLGRLSLMESECLALKRASCIVPQHCAGERSLAVSCYASASYGLSDTLVDANKQYEPMWLVVDSLVGRGFMIHDVEIP
jgi:hypothetical protein